MDRLHHRIRFRETRRIWHYTKKRKWENPFLTVKVFVICHGFLQLAQLLISGYLKSSISTIEKRFGLSSQTSGLIASFNEFGNTALIVFVSYFGSRVHRPRVIGFGALLVCAAGFLMSFPHFITGKYVYDTSYSSEFTNETDICQTMGSNKFFGSICVKSAMAGTAAVCAIFFIGQTILGIGGVPIQPFGISYIDDFAAKHNSPLYLGILFAVTVLGPGLAFMLGSAMLRYYVDIDKVKSEDVLLKPSDPRWVGAWWMGFLVASCLVLISAIPYFFFPKEMRRELLKEGKIEKELPSEFRSRHDLENLSLVEFIKTFPQVLLRNIRQPICVLIVLGQLTLTCMVVGLATFMAKFLERQFNITASFANLIIGAVNIPGAMIGIVAGGALMRRFRMSLRECALMCTVGLFLCVILSLPLLFIGCSTQNFISPNISFVNRRLFKSNMSDCYKNCNCRDMAYNPICGSDGIEYMSPCYAGCKAFSINSTARKVQNYTECSCMSSTARNEGFATPGSCGTNCYNYLLPFVTMSFLGGVLGSTSHTPSFMIILRTVRPEDKSIAVGLQYMILRALAWMPGPVLYGTVIDSTCLVWKEQCGEKKSCLYYDTDLFRYRFLGLQFAFQLLAFFCYLAAFLIIRRQEKKTAHLSDEASDLPKEKMTEEAKAEPKEQLKPERKPEPKIKHELRKKMKLNPEAKHGPAHETEIKNEHRKKTELNPEAKHGPVHETEIKSEPSTKSDTKPEAKPSPVHETETRISSKQKENE